MTATTLTTPSTSKTTRKRRSRKAKTTPLNRTPKTEVITVTESTAPARVRPEKPNLTWEDYRDDAKVRYEIHQYEVQELWNDCKWVYQQSLPYVTKGFNYVRDRFNSFKK
tara:strand:- start:234 stop:563 length:330 start_codon:yes stop_codon:yes gene_type:complete